MSNPLVRSKLKFYLEEIAQDAPYEDVSQGRQWRELCDTDLSGPMARSEPEGGNAQDFFVYKPALVASDEDGGYLPVMVTRWVLCGGKLWAKTHKLLPNYEQNGFYVDCSECTALQLNTFVESFPSFDLRHSLDYNLPSPRNIIGVVRGDEYVSDWSEPVRDPWRAKATGRRVYSMPLWFYCDDTSGNVSKHWNKYNLFLFTLAGLPAKYAQLMYNIHFVATLNNAPLLEMLEEIVRAMRELRKEGWEAWDCVPQEFVLIVPWILALLGNNPMQSKLSSHIGLSGRFCCRVCNVDKNGGRTEEEHVSNFIQCQEPRTLDGTLRALEEQLGHALCAAPSTAESAQTNSGVKDKYFDYFLTHLSETCANIKKKYGMGNNGKDKAKEILAELRKTMPDDLFNPGLVRLDPNASTPVKVLYTVLLGFVKYFWCDTVSRQSAEGKEELKQRLTSLDVTNLGLSALCGSTLIQFAGSLTGGNFRAIVQIAPAVLHSLVPDEIFAAWVSLSDLCTLVFRPAINGNLDVYLVCHPTYDLSCED
ncbi:unnamed protein product [Peniophora sp. CBMAI 1063]|nr:unnamed protein product [Peniophora sp. CBMAI 1063]